MNHSESEGKSELVNTIETRRSFLVKAWIVLGVAALLEILWIVFDILRPRDAKIVASNSIVIAGPIDRFKAGTVTPFPTGKFYLVRLDDGGFLAVSRECTHLGCTVPWVPDSNQFVCPCHASTFDMYGSVVESPASKALSLFQVRIENRVVKVDTSVVTNRRTFEPSQVVYS